METHTGPWWKFLIIVLLSIPTPQENYWTHQKLYTQWPVETGAAATYYFHCPAAFCAIKCQWKMSISISQSSKWHPQRSCFGHNPEIFTWLSIWEADITKVWLILFIQSYSNQFISYQNSWKLLYWLTNNRLITAKWPGSIISTHTAFDGLEWRRVTLTHSPVVCGTLCIFIRSTVVVTLL